MTGQISSQVPCLQELWLDDNQIKSIPDYINVFSNLSVINLQHNYLSNLPESLCDMTNLEEIYISHNYLTHLPPRIGQLPNLSRIWLDGNPNMAYLPVSLLENLTNPTTPLEHIHTDPEGQILNNFQCQFFRLESIPANFFSLPPRATWSSLTETIQVHPTLHDSNHPIRLHPQSLRELSMQVVCQMHNRNPIKNLKHLLPDEISRQIAGPHPACHVDHRHCFINEYIHVVSLDSKRFPQLPISFMCCSWSCANRAIPIK